MSSSEPPRRLVVVTLVEKSCPCEDGGGFERVAWRLWVNDGWLRLDKLLRRGSLGAISAELAHEDDPHGEASRGWSHLPPQVYWKREVRVTAPVGTRFCSRLTVPNRERACEDPLLPSVPHDTYDTYFELRATGCLVREDVLAQRRRARIVAVLEKPIAAEESRLEMVAILAALARTG